jgi:hypothetical protein
VGDPSLEVTMERWDPHAARWRLRCHRQAAERLLADWTGRRVARYLQRSLGMPLADAEDVVARVRAELQPRAGL